MKIKLTKTHTGPYGVFVKGRKVELPPAMLATIPKDHYEECSPPDKKEGTQSNGESKTSPKKTADK